jgi:hypothetical protein
MTPKVSLGFLEVALENGLVWVDNSSLPMRKVVFPFSEIYNSGRLNDPAVAMALTFLSPAFIDSACMILNEDSPTMRDTCI